MHAKAFPCPDCGHQAGGEQSSQNVELIAEFANRLQIHQRHSAISMLLKLAAGLCGMLTAFCWFRIIYFGSIAAFILVGLLSLLSAGLTSAVLLSERWFPTDLECPNCQARLDKYGEFGDDCPSCNSQLRGEIELPEEQEQEATPEDADCELVTA